jgi:enediyne biosynthesis protein E3
MSLSLGTLLKPVFPSSAASFRKMAIDRFGVLEDMDRIWPTFEPIAGTLMDGFYLALDHRRHESLVPRLDATPPELRGIAYEGAGMGLMVLDTLFPPRRRLPAFLHGPGARYRVLVLIGAGLALPRLPINALRFMDRQDPFLRWLVMDGYGFYEGFFSWRRTIERHAVPRWVSGYPARAFDQGLGRCLWFSTGAGVTRIADTVNTFPAHRRADLWSGIGVACAYAVDVADRDTIGALLDAAGAHRAELAVGAAVAAIVREQSGHAAAHTDLAAEVVWGTSTAEVAAIAHDASRGVRDGDGGPAYERWRQNLRDAWPRHAGKVSTSQEAEA